ncbi:MAG: hypothetical protein WGN25_16850 [Candidatus Electrothrix sp. GW3-4]|uniref:hypothetical protein n=1 Tax=Candidatus Electrothrix sp. GW3-4 TaxID=3126740 RepID=UPI0030CE5D1F
MALNQKKLQKKKAKQAAKSKARKTAQKQKGLMSAFSRKLAMQQAFNAPVYECWEAEPLFDQDSDVGIGSVMITRKANNGDILAGVFLIDVYCLGIKDCFVRVFNEENYPSFLEKVNMQGKLKKIHPTCARKLIEKAGEYAANLGFSPHKDYREAKKIFGDIESAACPRSFEFGKNGKPFYMAGPYDKPSFVKNVVNKLAKKCGPDEYHYVAPMDDDFLL